MSEEFDESPSPAPAALISIVAVDADAVKDAERLRLEVEGERDLIIAFAELNVMYLQTAFGDQFALVDGVGTPIATQRTMKIDPLAGDDPVA